ncbi:LysR family transcriptional regulator [Streptomyces fumigatiscleroticus]|nr:LysR family transcriptional regulator [Streptomyces fumigatiscleroticus]
MDVDLRVLRSFVAVAEELHFTRAAQRLHITQPALSKQIEQLERHLRLPLLRRSSRAVTLTAAGAALLPGARRLLADWEELLGMAQEVATTEARTLRVGFIANGASELTPRILTAFAGIRPDWRVTMTQALWTDPTAGLAAGDVDVALLRPPLPQSGPRISTRVLLTEERWVALPADHPLACQQVVRFEQLLDEPFIALPAEAGVWRDFWLALDHRDGHPVVIGAEVKTTDEWMEAIANNFGVCFTGASTARFYPRPGVVCRPVEKITPTEVAVAWREADRRRVVADFVTACAETAAAAAAESVDEDIRWQRRDP